MVRISQGLLMMISIGMFLMISVFALVRAEKVVMPNENQNSQAVSENVKLYEVSNIMEAEQAVGYDIQTIISLPANFSRKSIAYIPISKTQILVRQIFKQNEQNTLIFDQFPLDNQIQSSPSDFDKKEIVSVNEQQVSLYCKEDRVIQAQWQEEGMGYQLHMVAPLEKSTMVLLLKNIQ